MLADLQIFSKNYVKVSLKKDKDGNTGFEECVTQHFGLAKSLT